MPHHSNIASHNLEQMGNYAVLLVSFYRFLTHLDRLIAGAVISTDHETTNELAGEGIIITNDPDRNHADDDRFIITPHAPLLAALWEQIFGGRHGIYPGYAVFLPLIADTIEKHGNAVAPEELQNLILICVRDEAKRRVGEIANHIETLSRIV